MLRLLFLSLKLGQSLLVGLIICAVLFWFLKFSITFLGLEYGLKQEN